MPAALADVQVRGRCTLELRSYMAAEPAVQLPSGCLAALQSSYSLQLPWSRTKRCASEACCTCALGGMGYGPGSASVAYRTLTGTRGWLAGTTFRKRPPVWFQKSGKS